MGDFDGRDDYDPYGRPTDKKNFSSMNGATSRGVFKKLTAGILVAYTLFFPRINSYVEQGIQQLTDPARLEKNPLVERYNQTQERKIQEREEDNGLQDILKQEETR